jgi:hypothetical protein
MKNSLLEPELTVCADLVPLCVGERLGPGGLYSDGAGTQIHVDEEGAPHQLHTKVVHLPHGNKLFRLLTFGKEAILSRKITCIILT